MILLCLQVDIFSTGLPKISTFGINLDNRDILEQIKSDPQLFVREIKKNIAIDEAQKAPNLFDAIKARVDSGTNIKFILSGSTNFILYGGFPKIYELSGDMRYQWFADYISTYIERDIRQISQIADLSSFQSLYKTLSFQISNLLNKSNIANNIDIDFKTVQHYISVLEASYQINLLSPYSGKFKTQVSKSPKIYMYDNGILNFYQRNFDIESMINRGAWGAIFENHVFCELYKSIKDMVIKPSLSFWRNKNDTEVDFIIDDTYNTYPIEVKTSSVVRSAQCRALQSFISQSKKNIPFAMVIHRCEKPYLIKENVIGIPVGLLY